MSAWVQLPETFYINHWVIVHHYFCVLLKFEFWCNKVINSCWQWRYVYAGKIQNLCVIVSLKISWKSEKIQGKVREFLIVGRWQPCMCIVHVFTFLWWFGYTLLVIGWGAHWAMFFQHGFDILERLKDNCGVTSLIVFMVFRLLDTKLMASTHPFKVRYYLPSPNIGRKKNCLIFLATVSVTK